MKKAEALWLKDWTAKAVQRMFAIWHSADAASSATTSASMAYALRTVSRILQEAAREGVPEHPLCKLPRHVLCNIRSHLTLLDTLTLSRTSRSLRSVVFESPELWTDLSGPYDEPMILHEFHLHMYVTRSVAEPLHVSLLSTGDMLASQAPQLAYAMPRIVFLRLDCCDTPEDPDCAPPSGSLRGSQAWARLLEVLMQPAPRLASLYLRHVEGNLFGYNPLSDEHIEIDWPLFAGTAPCLRRCRLTAVLLPPPALCGAFRDLIMFSYRLIGHLSPSMIAHVLEAMPRLEVLELDAAEMASEALDGSPPPVEVRHSSLRVMMCSFAHLEIAELASVLPLAQLQELWLSIEGPPPDTLTEIELLYPATGTGGMHLGLSHRLDSMDGALHPAADAATPTVFLEILGPRRQPELRASFACITWLSVHEHLLDNSALGALPAAPRLGVLCVRMADAPAHAERRRARVCSGFLVGGDEHQPWALPALREVRVGAAPGVPVSIALHDIARWIRRALAFGAASLDTVVLSGIWVADLDFCAGWAALSEQTASILLEEEADPRYFVSEDNLSSQALDVAIRSVMAGRPRHERVKHPRHCTRGWAAWASVHFDHDQRAGHPSLPAVEIYHPRIH